jgi:hypothetical protein
MCSGGGHTEVRRRGDIVLASKRQPQHHVGRGFFYHQTVHGINGMLQTHMEQNHMRRNGLWVMKSIEMQRAL